MDKALDAYGRVCTFPRMIADLVRGFLAGGERGHLSKRLMFPT